MAIEVRKQKGKLKVYRRAYNPALKKGKADYVGSLPLGSNAIPDSLCALLTEDEIGQLRVKLGGERKAEAEIVADAADHSDDITRTVKALYQFSETASELLASDRDRLNIAAKSMVAAFRRVGVITIGNIDYVEQGAVLVEFDDGDPFAIPAPLRKAETEEQVYGTTDDGRIAVKAVLAEDVDGLPVPGELGRTKAAERYPGIDVDGLVSEWHNQIGPNASSYAGKSQFDVDSDFIYAVPQLVAASLRSKLPSGTRVADFKDEAERIAWEDNTPVTDEQLWRYAKRLEGFGGDRRTPVSTDLITDLRAFLGLGR